jgi:hypothetical protein
MKHKRVRISDHAIVRYLERVGGFDIERLRAEMARRLQPSADVRAGSVKIDGCIVCLSYADPHGPVVTTVLLPEEHLQPHIKMDRR